MYKNSIIFTKKCAYYLFCYFLLSWYPFGWLLHVLFGFHTKMTTQRAINFALLFVAIKKHNNTLDKPIPT